MLAREAGEQRDPYRYQGCDRYMGPERAYVGTGQRAWCFFKRASLLGEAFINRAFDQGKREKKIGRFKFFLSEIGRSRTRKVAISR